MSVFLQRLSKNYKMESCLPVNKEFFNLYKEMIDFLHYRYLEDIIMKMKTEGEDLFTENIISGVGMEIFSENITWTKIILFILFAEKMMELYPSNNYELETENYVKRYLLKWMKEHPLTNERPKKHLYWWYIIGCLSLFIIILYCRHK